MLGGRGAGKTRAGAEWVRARIEAPPHKHPARRIALIGETFAAARSVMVEGVSGLLAISPPDLRPQFLPSRNLLVWPNGAEAQIFSAERPDALRGPQFDLAWCDELAKWRYDEACWDMLQFGLRLGAQPRQMVSTTPRPTPLIKQLLGDLNCAVTRAETKANAANLADGFMDRIEARYGGTNMGVDRFGQGLKTDKGTEILGPSNPPAVYWTSETITLTPGHERFTDGRVAVAIHYIRLPLPEAPSS